MQLAELGSPQRRITLETSQESDPDMRIIPTRTTICAMAALGLMVPAAFADPMTITDIAGRVVTLPDAPQRIILGEGRMMYAIAPLATDDPFEHVVGWKDDLILYDPDAFRKFETAFPEDTARMVNFGNPYSGDFSIEAVIENKADLLILDLGNLFKAQETGLIKKLDEAGVPVVFIDFRRDPTANAIPSMLMLGRLLEQEARAAEFIDFYVAEMRKVTNIVQTLSVDEKPLVFMENAAGWNPEFCCNTFGSYNYGRFIELAGGRNYGSEKFSGYSSEVSLEGLIAADPDVLLGTGANWAEARPEVTATLWDMTPTVLTTKHVCKHLQVVSGSRICGPYKTGGCILSIISSTTARTTSSRFNRLRSGCTPMISQTLTLRRHWQHCTVVSCHSIRMVSSG